MRRAALLALSIAVVLLAGATAHAQSSTTPAAEQRPRAQTRRYVGSMVLGDLAAGGVGLATMAGTGDGEWLATVALGGPVVHAMRRHPGRAFVSLVLRGLPFIAGRIGYEIDLSTGRRTEFDGLSGIVYGGGLTAIAVLVVDYAFLARETDEAPAAAPAASAWLAPVEGGALAGVGGAW
jgi:hypothetical protein